MDPINFQLTLADFEAVPWKKALEVAGDKSCTEYLDGLMAGFRYCQSTNDQRGQNVYKLLNVAAALKLSEDPNRPLVAPFPCASGIEVFGENAVESILKLAPTVEDPELRARLCDVAISAARKYKECCEIAVQAYLESATRLKNARNLELPVERLRRVGQLVAYTERKNDVRWERWTNAVVQVIEIHRSDEKPWICEELMRILLRFKQGRPTECIRLCEEIALRAEKEGDWGMSRRFLRCKADWHSVTGEEEARLASLIGAARTYIGEADSALKRNPPSHSACHANLKHAVEALRKLPGTRQEVEGLHTRILEEGKFLGSECSQFSVTVNPVDQIDQTQQIFRQLTLHESLKFLGERSGAPPIELLKVVSQQCLASTPFSHLFGRTYLSEDGKQIAKVAPGDLTGPLDSEAMTEVYMHQANESNRNVWVDMFIRPALEVIRSSHRSVAPRDLEFLVLDNPFVPPGREVIFLRGILAGFEEDFLVACHLLIPQIENSLRYMIVTHGGDIRTSRLHPNGDQPEILLDGLLDHTLLKSILDPGLHFDLRGLLSCRGAGENFRNRLCHGLVDFGEFGGTSAVYVWWIVYHICARPDLLRLQEFKPPAPAAG
ncbi:MAG: DUF4209 domain-containing protein [Verrucomicrobiota bacterium]